MMNMSAILLDCTPMAEIIGFYKSYINSVLVGMKLLNLISIIRVITVYLMFLATA